MIMYKVVLFVLHLLNALRKWEYDAKAVQSV